MHVEGLRIEPPSLEELFLRHYGDDAHNTENPGTSDDHREPTRRELRENSHR